MITENSAIQTLSLRGNQLADKHAKAIAEGLKQNQSLKGIIILISS
jgi:hypothetical protein